MRKLALVFTLIVIAFAFAACDSYVASNQDTGFTYIHASFTLSIAPVRDDLLASFEYIHEMDYYEVRGFLRGERLVIWADVPLYNFAVVDLSHDFADDAFIYFINSTHGEVDLLLPGQAFVVNNYIVMGSFPWSGFTFTDANNERHYFAMVQDQSDSDNHFNIWPIEVVK